MHSHSSILDAVLKDLPGVKANGPDSWRFHCTQEHKKRHAPAWVAILSGKVRIGCHDDDSHNDDLWQRHVRPNIPRLEPSDWLAPLAVAGVSRISKGQFDDAIIYGPIWGGPYLLPIEQRELDRREEVAELAGSNLLRAAIADQMGQTLPTLSLSQYQDQPTIGQMLHRPQRAASELEEMTGSLKGPDLPLKGTCHLLLRATRPPDMTCHVSTAWSEAILPDGSVKIRHQPCSECDQCLAWRRRENALRFVYVAADVECTTIQVSGWASSEWDKAAAWLDAMGRRQPGQRWRGLRPAEDFTPTATAIYPCEVPAAVIELAKSDAARKGLTLTVQYGAVSVAAFGGIQDTLKTRTGNVLNKETGKYVRHCTSRFVAWPDFEDALPDYVTGDTVVHQSGKDVELPDETPASEMESNLRNVKDVERRAESAAYIRMGRVEYLDVGLFLNLPNEPDRDGEVMQTIKRREYGGSAQLLIDAALHYVGDTPYRAAYCAVYERVFGDDWGYEVAV